jgi:hypothetical protein
VKRAAGVVVSLREYRAARRATEVLRGLLREVPLVSGLRVQVEANGAIAIVVGVQGLRKEMIRSCVPTSVNGVRVRVQPA